MADMLVRLYDLPDYREELKVLNEKGIQISRAMAPDKYPILKWVEERSSIHGKGEADVCFSKNPISMFVATRGKDILGYACYNATQMNFFGPTRVLDEEQGQGIGKVLLKMCLSSMRNEGYAYAIIGGVGPKDFYKKTVNAIDIPLSTPGAYKDFIGARK